MSNTSENENYYDWKGKIILNKYILIKRINHGAYAVVWMGYNYVLKKLIAVKIFNTIDSDSGIMEYETYTELKKLNIPGMIIPFLKTSLEDNNKKKHVCILMELMACSLYDIMYLENRKLFDLSKMIKQVTLSINTLHKNKYIHADIKPENLLLGGRTKEVDKIYTDLLKCKNIIKIKEYVKNMSEYDHTSDYSDMSDSDSNMSQICLSNSTISNKKNKIEIDDVFLINPTVYLSDFGGCFKFTDDLKHKYHSRFMHTVYYMAPEIILKLPCTPNVDLWSFGCTLYELITDFILFNPDDVLYMKNRFHLYKIISCIDDIPSEMKLNSPLYDIFFKVNGNIKSINYIEKVDIFDVFTIEDQFKNIIKGCLKIRPEDRILEL